MDWDEVKDALCKGFSAARKFNEVALGIELSDFRHGVVGTEYVATVEIARRLFFPIERCVAIELPAKQIRKAIHGSQNSIALNLRIRDRKQGNKEIMRLKTVAENYKFGKKDSQRVDIAVLDQDARMPKVVIEIKIHNGSYDRFENDIKRTAKLVQMYSELAKPNSHDFFGVASIYHQKIGEDFSSGSANMSILTNRINDMVSSVSLEFPALDIRLETVCSGEEPIRVSDKGEPEEALTRDKMGYIVLAVVICHKQHSSSSGNHSPSNPAPNL